MGCQTAYRTHNMHTRREFNLKQGFLVFRNGFARSCPLHTHTHTHTQIHTHTHTHNTFVLELNNAHFIIRNPKSCPVLQSLKLPSKMWAMITLGYFRTQYTQNRHKSKHIFTLCCKSAILKHLNRYNYLLQQEL